jgi:hypothetical protein
MTSYGRASQRDTQMSILPPHLCGGLFHEGDMEEAYQDPDKLDDIASEREDSYL